MVLFVLRNMFFLFFAEQNL